MKKMRFSIPLLTSEGKFTKELNRKKKKRKRGSNVSPTFIVWFSTFFHIPPQVRKAGGCIYQIRLIMSTLNIKTVSTSSLSMPRLNKVLYNFLSQSKAKKVYVRRWGRIIKFWGVHEQVAPVPSNCSRPQCSRLLFSHIRNQNFSYVKFILTVLH